MHTFYPTDFKGKDPRVYLYKYPSYIDPTRLSKSFSNFLHYSKLELMESVAKDQGKIIVPFCCFTWRRIRALKEKNIFYFKVGTDLYFIINALDLKQIERDKLEHYLQDLKWNRE